MITKLSEDEKKRLHIALYHVRMAYSVMAACILVVLVGLSAAELTILIVGHNGAAIVAMIVAMILALTAILVYDYVFGKEYSEY